MSNKQPCVYILASKRNGTLYTGVTSELIQRVYQHKNEFTEGFTKKYGVHLLVYYELHELMETAITREKQIKKWIPAFAGMTGGSTGFALTKNIAGMTGEDLPILL